MFLQSRSGYDNFQKMLTAITHRLNFLRMPKDVLCLTATPSYPSIHILPALHCQLLPLVVLPNVLSLV